MEPLHKKWHQGRLEKDRESVLLDRAFDCDGYPHSIDLSDQDSTSYQSPSSLWRANLQPGNMIWAKEAGWQEATVKEQNGNFCSLKCADGRILHNVRVACTTVLCQTIFLRLLPLRLTFRRRSCVPVVSAGGAYANYETPDW